MRANFIILNSIINCITDTMATASEFIYSSVPQLLVGKAFARKHVRKYYIIRIYVVPESTKS